MENRVDHPKHYNMGTIEVIDYIKSALGTEGCYNFCIGNVIKYVSRAGHKENLVEDLEKAAWYLQYAKDLKKDKAREAKKATEVLYSFAEVNEADDLGGFIDSEEEYEEEEPNCDICPHKGTCLRFDENT